jgi:putative nucleotidyltransferase with HDIG domain
MKGNGSNRPEVKAAATRIQRGLEERAGWWDVLLDRPLLWALLAIVGCTWLVLPRVGGGLPEWLPGDVATFDLVVPHDLSLPDEEATEAVREEARASVIPVYDLEPRLSVEAEDELHILFEACRDRLAGEADEVASIAALTDLRLTDAMQGVLDADRCSEDLEAALVEVVSQLYRANLVDDRRALERRGERGIALRNLASGSEKVIPLESLSGAIDVRTGLEEALRDSLLEQPVVARRWIKPTVEFLEDNLVPNLVFNRGETAQRQRAEAEKVTPRSRSLRRGQILVRRGDTVTLEVAEVLRVLRQERRDVAKAATSAGIALLMALMILGWWPLLSRFAGPQDAIRRLSIVYILILLFTALDRLGIYLAEAIAFHAQGPLLSSAEVFQWGLPFAAGPVTVLVLVGMQPALLFAVCGAGIAGVILGGDFSIAVYALASGVIGALATQRSKDRASMSRVGALVGLANAVLVLVLELFQGLPNPPSMMVVAAGCAFIGGPLSVGVVSFLLPVLEGLFGVTTDTRLLELSNQNLPLLKRLSLEAPGTYQHSLAVGNLAEAGADAVGANALLVRVCAYYHDVGKLVKPDYFVENQHGDNPHDGLAPSMSALVIMSHVKEGLELAREARLPMTVRQAIATHHGTKLIRFFFNKANKSNRPDLDEVRESEYRYPGPKPHTKELGILLLADAVEAAARTLENPTPGKVQTMITKIFTDVLEDDQLADCDLTFSELDKVASAFLWVLTHMYHNRIDYPGFDFNRGKNRGPSPHQLGEKAVEAGR